MSEWAENVDFSTHNSFTTIVALKMGQMCTDGQTKREKADSFETFDASKFDN